MKTVAELAALITEMVDPRRGGDELVALAKRLADDEVNDVVVVLAAVHSACIDNAVTQLDMELDMYLRRFERGLRDNMYAVEQQDAEGGMFL